MEITQKTAKEYLLGCSNAEFYELEGAHEFLKSMVNWVVSGSNSDELPMWNTTYGTIPVPLSFLILTAADVLASQASAKGLSLQDRIRYQTPFKRIRGIL